MSEKEDVFEGLTLDSVVELSENPPVAPSVKDETPPKDDSEGDETPPEGGTEDDSPEEEPPTGDDAKGDGEPEGEPEGDGDDLPQILEAVKNSGYEFSDEELNDLNDTPEGLEKAASMIAQKKAEDIVNEFLSSDPRLEAHAKFVMAGGDSQKFLETFYPQDDWTKVEIQDDNLDGQRQILDAYFKEKGTNSEIAKATIDNFVESDKLKVNAERALQELQKVQESRKSKLVEQQTKEQQKMAAQQEQAWKKVTSAVEQEASFGGVPVPPAKRKAFLDYMSKPADDQGRTQRDIDLANMTLEQQLAFEAFLFNGMDVSGLVSTKTRTKQTQAQRFRLKKDDKKQQNRSGAVPPPEGDGGSIVSPL